MDMNNEQQEACGMVDILYVHTQDPAWYNWLYRVPYLAS